MLIAYNDLQDHLDEVIFDSRLKDSAIRHPKKLKATFIHKGRRRR
jgi:hypothetical protein